MIKTLIHKPGTSKNRVYYFLIICLFISACKNSVNKDHSASIDFSPVIRIADEKKTETSWSKENTIVYHIISEPDNLHPTNGNSSPRSEIFLYTQQMLLNIDFFNQSITPVLVKNLPVISESGLQFTYELSNQPTWDDGKKLSVDDIIFTAKAFKCPLTHNPVVKGYWENLKTIQTDPLHPNQFTLIMKNKSIQNIAFLTSFAMMERHFHDPQNVLSKFSFEQFDDTNFKAAENTVLLKWAYEFNQDQYGRDPRFLNGLGPYRVEKWEPGQFISLVRKQNHWTSGMKTFFAEAKPEKIIFSLNKDENSVQLEFKAQTYDISTNVSTSTLISLSGNEAFNKNYHTALSPTYNYTYVAFNEKPDGVNRKKLFTDSIVRRALAYLTPVDNIIKIAYKSFSSDCHRMISNVSPAKKEFNKSLTPIPFDPSRSRELLQSAGWKDSDGDGTLDKIVDGEKIQMVCDLAYLNTSPDWKDMASLISEEFAKSGIKVHPVAMDLRLFVEKGKSHDFDMILGSWGATSLPEDYSQLWHTSSWQTNGSNYTGFGNLITDALIDSIKIEMNDQNRNRMINDLQQKIYDDQPYVFLYCNLRRNIIHKRFGNIILFADRPGILLNTLQLLSTNNGITMTEEVSPK